LTLGTVEVGLILGLMNLLFVSFVIVQVPYLFGVCGHGNIGFLDAAANAADRIKTISVHHEQAAGYMADAYYKNHQTVQAKEALALCLEIDPTNQKAIGFRSIRPVRPRPTQSAEAPRWTTRNPRPSTCDRIAPHSWS